jgi:hypothetical protein
MRLRIRTPLLVDVSEVERSFLARVTRFFGTNEDTPTASTFSNIAWA